MEDLVRTTQKMLTEWKIRARRKRFRFQNVQVKRLDLSLCLTQLFCQHSDYGILELIQAGINCEKKAIITILENEIMNLPQQKSPYVNKDSEIVKLKTPIIYQAMNYQIDSRHCKNWFGNERSRGGTESRKKWNGCRLSEIFPLLKKTFEENGGYINPVTVDELEKAFKGDLSRYQIQNWFTKERSRCGVVKRKKLEFTKFQKSMILQAFEEHYGSVSGEELDRLIEALGGNFTRDQIRGWFKRSSSCGKNKI